MRKFLPALALSFAAGCASQKAQTTEAPPVAQAPLAADAFRNQAPKPSKAPEIALPRFEQAKLANGVTVLVVQRKELPLLAVKAAFLSGSAQDPQGKDGLAELTYRMLLEGAAGKDAISLDNAFADLGTSPALSVAPDGASVGVTVLARNAQAAFGLLADVVRKPTFGAKDFERRKKQQLVDLSRRLGNPRFLAESAYLQALYGKTHPYAHPVPGTPASVEKLRLQDAKGFYEKHVGPATTALVFAGDITLDQAVKWTETAFGDWKGKAQVPPAPATPPVTPRTQVIFVPKPGLGQTLITVGRPGLAMGHPDEYALELASTVFGSFFGSRLNMNLREAKGYSYGARASSETRYGVGPLTASSAVRADVTGPALVEVMNEVNGLKSRPITAVELAAAREGQIRSFPGAFETVEGLAGSAAQLFYAHRPLDEFQQAVAGLTKATPAEVQKAAESYFEPGSLQIVLVGDPEIIQKQVASLNLGPLVAQPVNGSAAPKK